MGARTTKFSERIVGEKELVELRQHTSEWLGKMQAKGTNLAKYGCPRCEGDLYSPIPAEGDGPYDSLVVCPHCGRMHFRITWSDGSVDTNTEVTAREVA